MRDHALAERSPAWSSIPTALLQAELQRRQAEAEKPQCGSSQKGTYNTPIHVFALFLVLFLSTAGCGFPLISKRASKHAGPHGVVFFSQHFGTGVLIATAFVHLLPTAFLSLTDPCLPYIWSEGYRQMAGVIAMTAVLLVVGIEMFLRTRGVVHSHSHMEDWEKDSTDLPLRNHRNRKMSVRRRPDNIAMENLEASQGLMNGASPSPGSLSNMNGSSKHGQEEDGNDSDLNLDELDPRGDLSHDIEQSPRGHMHSLTETEEEEQKRLVLQCMLLEAGILFHSVFIGMALSVATGTPFVIFLIAICFHQTFEGMALGSRIAAIKFPRRSVKPWIMVLAYGATTPIGQAIGLGVHTLYDPRSEAGLLMVGIMNAISSGLLLFAGLVQLLAEDFLSDKSYGVLKGSKRLQAYIAVISGAALMSLVGAWA